MLLLLAGRWLDHGMQYGGTDDYLDAEVTQWPGVFIFSLTSQRTHASKRGGQQQLDVLFGHRVDRALPAPVAQHTATSSSLRALCGTATAVPRMFARTAPCVSKDILVGTWETDTTPLVRPNEKCCCSLVRGAPRDPSLRDAQRREEHRHDGRQQRVQSLREGVRRVADTRRVTCTPQRPQPPKTVRVTATAQSDSDKTATHNQTPAPADTHIVTPRAHSKAGTTCKAKI